MIVGIDLGTTNSAIAYINGDGKPEIIPSSEGDRTTPSVILFEEESRVAVGKAARDNAITAPGNVVQFVKSQMGNTAYRFIPEAGSKDREYTPEELSSLILKKLKADAESFLGCAVDSAVITVPAYFNDAQRKATQDAGELAGLEVVKVINEPTAAALAYGLLNGEKNLNVLVYDLGGGTFDATIVSIRGKEVQVRATDGIRELGGRDFDDCIVSMVEELFRSMHGIDFDEEVNFSAYQELRSKAEECKKQLSFKSKAAFSISCGGQAEKTTLTREQFESMAKNLCSRTGDKVEDVLEQAGLAWKDIGKILLVGGASRMPMVSSELKRLSGLEPSWDINPDEAVAAGAALQARELELEDKLSPDRTKILDVTSQSVGVVALDAKTRERCNTVVLKRNTPIPAKGAKTFYTVDDSQEIILLEVTEGDDTAVDYVNIVGSFEVPLPPRLQANTEVNIEVVLDEDQIIHVFTWLEKAGGSIKELQINRRSNMTSEQLQKSKAILSTLEVESAEPELELPKEARVLEEFIGMNVLKEQICRIINQVKFQQLRSSHYLKITGRRGYHLVLTGNPGTGKTTAARVLGDIFAAVGIIEENKIVEVDRSSLISNHIGESELITRQKLAEARGGILLIDEAYALFKEDSSRDFGSDIINTLVKALEDERGDLIVILTGYSKEMDSFLDSNPGLKSRFSFSIDLPDYTDEELLQIAHKMAGENSLVLSDEAEKAFLECIQRERMDERFGNARVVRNLVDEAFRRMSSRLLSRPVSDTKELILLQPEDFGMDNEATVQDRVGAALKELDRLTGLKEAKKQVQDITAFVQAQLKRKEAGYDTGSLSLHMAFTGNPGTGKTTVARVIGKIYKALGILRKGEVFIECNRADLVGSHLGETALKTRAVIKRALGGILFIDEAYSLFQDDRDVFGREAVDTLIKEMEDKRDNLVVILAGYPDKLAQLLQSNPGFRSRIKTTVHFEDYSPNELMEIFEGMSEEEGYVLTEAAVAKLQEAVEQLHSEKDETFGNGREVRNLFERIKLKQSRRIVEQELSGEALMIVEAEDITCE